MVGSGAVAGEPGSAGGPPQSLGVQSSADADVDTGTGAGSDAAEGDDFGPNGAFNAQRVRDAASRTAALPTARYLLTLSWQGDGAVSPVLQVDGQVDLTAGRSSARVRQWLATATSDGLGSGATEVVVDGPWLYLRSETLGQVAGTGSSWLRMSTGPAGQPAPAAVTGLLTLLDLAASGDEPVADTVAGAATQRFRVVLVGPSPVDGTDVGSGAAGVGSGDLGGFAVIGDQVLVWVGDDGLVRAIEAVVHDTAAGPAPGASRLVMRYELVEVGGVVDITVPSPAEVVDVNDGS